MIYWAIRNKQSGQYLRAGGDGLRYADANAGIKLYKTKKMAKAYGRNKCKYDMDSFEVVGLELNECECEDLS